MKRILATLSLICLAATPAFAEDAAPAKAAAPSTSLADMPSGAYRIDQSHASIVFSLSHLGFSQYHGRFNTVDGLLAFNAKDVEKSQLQIVIDTGSVDTISEKLDEKLKTDTFFNVGKFPNATFYSSKLEKLSDTKGRITGELTLLGVKKPVVLDVTLNRAGINPYAGVPTLGFSATATIKRSDFGMKAYLPDVGDEVTIAIEAEFNQDKPKAKPANE